MTLVPGGDSGDAWAALADRYRLRAHRAARAQYLAGKRNQRMHVSLGVPVVILTSLAGTAVFASLSTEPAVWAVVATGAVSVVSAVLAALQTFFQHAQRAAQHRAAGAQYAALKRDFDLWLLELRAQGLSDELDGRLRLLSDQLSRTEAASPDVPDRWYDQARREQDADLEGV